MAEERMQVPARMPGRNAGVVGPWRERAQGLAEDHAAEAENRGDEGTCPAAAEISELRDRLGEEI